MLNIGDKVYLPNYGAGLVKKIELSEICGKIRKYIYISLVLDNIDLFIPEGMLKSYNIRKLEDKETLEKALNIISAEPAKIEKKWNKRYRDHNGKIASGDIQKQCEVIRDLYYLKQIKLLPLGEEKILDRVENFVASEIMMVYNLDFSTAVEKIRMFYKK